MIRVTPLRSVATAVQSLSRIRPTTRYRNSPWLVTGQVTNERSSHSACASSKSIPCLALFAALLAGSYSNGMIIKYTEIIPDQYTFGCRRKRTRRLMFRIDEAALRRAARAAFHDGDDIGHDRVQVEVLRRVDGGDAGG